MRRRKGDITKINGAKVEPIEVIIGGSPCQDLSVAGKRAGLDGERSGLFMEQIRIIKEMRENDRANGLTQEPLWETDSLSLGEFSMLNFSECPSVAVESHLSQILEANPHPKYFLSPRSCRGILNRAERRK